MKAIRKLCSLTLLTVFAYLPLNAYATDNFQAIYQQYLHAIEAQDYKAALEHAENSLRAGQQLFDASSENLRNLRFNYANMLTANRKFSDAYEELDKLEQVTIERYGEVSEQTLEVRIERYYASVKSHSSETSYEKHKKDIGRSLVELVEQLSADQPEKQANYYAALMAIMQRSNSGFLSLRRMIKLTEKAEGILLEAFGASDTRVIETQFYLAKLLKTNNKLRGSAEKFETIVNVIDASVDFTHPWALSAHAQLVDIYETMGRSEEATEHCIAIGEMTPWDDNVLEPTPLFRVNPEYPRSYARARKEGKVIIEFDISEGGFVTNPRVIEVEGGDKFADSSIVALERWRYAPKFQDGQVQVAKNRRVQMDFYIGR